MQFALAPTDLSLASGMVASARIQPQTGGRLVRIPAGALVSADGRAGSVFVYAGGRAQRRAVTVAFIDGEQLALSAGLNRGETVITDGAAFLDDGELVAITPP